MQLRGSLPRTVVAEVVDVYAVDDMHNAALASDFVEPGKQLVFAVEATVGVIGYVIGIIELAGSDVLMANAVFASKGFSVGFVRFGVRVGVRGDRHLPVT